MKYFVTCIISQQDAFPLTVPGPCEPEDLIDGIIFAANYLGCTQVLSDKNPSKSVRMSQAHEAIGRIKVIGALAVSLLVLHQNLRDVSMATNNALCLGGSFGRTCVHKRSSVSGVELNLGFSPADKFPFRGVEVPTAELRPKILDAFAV